jgi:hypothetical protein
MGQQTTLFYMIAISHINSFVLPLMRLTQHLVDRRREELRSLIRLDGFLALPGSCSMPPSSAVRRSIVSLRGKRPPAL